MATGLEQLSQLIKLCLDLDILISAIIDHSYMPINMESYNQLPGEMNKFHHI